MIHPVPFAADHFRRMSLQPAQARFVRLVTEEQLHVLEGPLSFTLLDDTTPLACTGAWQLWHNRAYVWAFIADKVTPAIFGEVHSFARAFVGGLPFRRLEMAVDVGFENGHRWAKAMGFDLETPEPMRAFHADGRDAFLYARINEVPHG